MKDFIFDDECKHFSDEIRTHTALHILKGAIVRMLGRQALWTASVYVKGKHGRIAVTYEKNHLRAI